MRPRNVEISPVQEADASVHEIELSPAFGTADPKSDVDNNPTASCSSQPVRDDSKN